MLVITLITDFGTVDGYVGAMKGVILDHAGPSSVQLVDIAHDIPAQDIETGAWCLATCWAYFPQGTIHVVVVDPGVGSDRQALIARVDGHYLIGPDNGVFTHPLLRSREREVRRIHPDIHLPESLSATFHGRDIFGYVAGLLASGKQDWTSLSEPASQYTLLAVPRPEYGETTVLGRVIHIDRYGNLITNIEGERIASEAQWTVRVGGADIAVRGLASTYADADKGRPVVLVGSAGYVEVAVTGGSACRVFNTEKGAPITMKRLMQ